MDLVEEQDLALRQCAEESGEVAGPLDRGPAGDAQRRAELGGDDHRECRLAESGRAGQQHVVRRPSPNLGRVQDEGELFANAFLPDELVEPLGPQRRLDNRVVVDGFRSDELTHSGPRRRCERSEQRCRVFMCGSTCEGLSSEAQRRRARRRRRLRLRLRDPRRRELRRPRGSPNRDR